MYLNSFEYFSSFQWDILFKIVNVASYLNTVFSKKKCFDVMSQNQTVIKVEIYLY